MSTRYFYLTKNFVFVFVYVWSATNTRICDVTGNALALTIHVIRLTAFVDQYLKKIAVPNYESKVVVEPSVSVLFFWYSLVRFVSNRLYVFIYVLYIYLNMNCITNTCRFLRRYD